MIKRNFERLTLIFITIMSFSYIIEFYTQSYSRMATIMLRTIQLFPLVFPIILILDSYRKRYNFFSIYVLFTFFTLLSYTAVQIVFHGVENLGNTGIYFSIITALLIRKLSIDDLRKALLIVALLGILGFFYVFSILNIDIQVALRRGYTWTESFYYASLYWAVIPMVILAFLTRGKTVLISLAYWLCAIIINLFFLKRFIIVDSLLLIVILIIIQTTTEKGLKKIRLVLRYGTLVLLLVLTSLLLLGDIILPLFDAVVLRISNTREEISSFDRFVESVNYLREASLFDIAIGKGFLGVHYGLGKRAYALHVGWVNFVFKGGLLLLSVVIIPYLKMLSLVPKIKKLPIKIQFCLYFMTIYSVRLLYVNMHSFLPEMTLFFYCLFNVMDYRPSNTATTKGGSRI